MRQKQVLPPFNGAAAGRYAPAHAVTQCEGPARFAV